jgi:hypothetical protein
MYVQTTCSLVSSNVSKEHTAPISSTLKTKAAGSSKLWATNYHSTQYYYLTALCHILTTTSMRTSTLIRLRQALIRNEPYTHMLLLIDIHIPLPHTNVIISSDSKNFLSTPRFATEKHVTDQISTFYAFKQLCSGQKERNKDLACDLTWNVYATVKNSNDTPDK